MELLGWRQLPGAKTLGNWLRRVARSAQAMLGLVNVNKRILAAVLYNRKKITLDKDATVMESNKRRVEFTYKKHRSYTPMGGYIFETGQVVAIEFRKGNEFAYRNIFGLLPICQLDYT